MKPPGTFGLNHRTNTDPRFGQNPIPFAGGQDYRGRNQGFGFLLVEGRGSQEKTMRAATVYRADCARKTRLMVFNSIDA